LAAVGHLEEGEAKLRRVRRGVPAFNVLVRSMPRRTSSIATAATLRREASRWSRRTCRSFGRS